MSAGFWIRWSGRDLRRRWLVVVAIAATIAIGTGTYAGLSSISEWRRLSNDASYAALEFHDLQIGLTAGSSVPEGALRSLVDRIASRDAVVAVEERLVAPTQVDATGEERDILAPGRIVGIDLADGVSVDRPFAVTGRVLAAPDTSGDVVMLDASFADRNRLTIPSQITLPGGFRARMVGTGASPEYLYLTTNVTGSIGAQSSFAIVYAPLAFAQQVAGLTGRVNDVAIRVAPGVDPSPLRTELQEELARALPGVGATVALRRDNDAYRVLYDDIASDQEIYSIFALILLGAGTFAAFNLASRIIESQRRELGVGMALGVPPRQLAIRPLMLGVQIAMLGVMLGVPLGLWVGRAILSVFERALPMPEWRSPFQPDVFARGAILGIALPILAVALPTLRAVRMPPVRAVEAGFRAARGAGLAAIATRVRLPGRTLARMPLRNLLRAPRRTVFTVLGIGAAVVTAVGVSGMVDSFVRTLDVTSEALVGPNRDRITVSLRDFAPVEVAERARSALGDRVTAAEPALRLPATLSASGTKTVEVLLEVQHATSAVFRPHLSSGSFAQGAPGIVVTAKAASDLGVGVGDRIRIEHPVRTGPASFRTGTDAVRVTGLVDNPLRIYAYMDASQAPLFGLGGQANAINMTPAPAADVDAIKRILLGVEGVASAERVAAASEALDEALRQYTDVLRIVELVALALALLVAFNSASIATDERAREYATLFAFGIPLRTVMRNAVAEGVAAGVVATAAGIAGGLLVIGYIVNVTTPRVLPDLGAIVSISAGTVATGALVGIAASAAAPLLTARRLARMDVPSTLRVVE